MKRRYGVPPECHPERKHYALGLCQRCYSNKLRRETVLTPEATARAAEKGRRYYSEQSADARKRRAHANNIQRYGITVETFDRLLAQQQGRCAICGHPPRGRRRLSIDHHHDTGVVRGLLCNICNMFVGFVDADDRVIARLAEHSRRRECP